jgi:hypothetical protein
LFALDFLDFVGRQTGQPGFVSENGVIKAKRITKTSIRRGSASPVTTQTWYHRRLLVDDGKPRTGHAIGDETLSKLRSQADNISCDFIRRRTEALFNLLENIGGRRAEIGNFLVSSLRRALATDEPQPLVMIQSRKGLRGATREVPVDRHVLEDVLDFVDTERRTLLNSNNIPESAVDMLFISQRTCRPLSIRYITTIFYNLKKRAGINEKAHAHQLRHLYISRKFEERVLEAIGASTSPLRSLDTIMAAVVWEIMQYSGHKRPGSLDTYVKVIKQKLFKMLVSRASAKKLKPTLSSAITDLMLEVSKLKPEDLEEFFKAKLAELRKV